MPRYVHLQLRVSTNQNSNSQNFQDFFFKTQNVKTERNLINLHRNALYLSFYEKHFDIFFYIFKRKNFLNSWSNLQKYRKNARKIKYVLGHLQKVLSILSFGDKIGLVVILNKKLGFQFIFKQKKIPLISKISHVEKNEFRQNQRKCQNNIFCDIIL